MMMGLHFRVSLHKLFVSNKVVPFRCMCNPMTKYRKALKEAETENDGKERWNMNIGGVFLLAIPVATFCLGIWQVKRWRWKLQLIEEMEQKVGAEAVDFPVNDLSQLPSLEYRKVRVRGTFDCTKELIMGPRSLISSKKYTESQGLMSNPVTGYHVITPFKVANANQDFRILVNRGWIPTKNYKNFKTENSQEVEIIGVVRMHENRPPFMANNVLGEHGLWFSRDVHAMSNYLGTDEVFLDLASVQSKDSRHSSLTPVPGQTRVTLKNDHVSYFFTWFSLSAITAYMWHRLYILKKPLR